MVDDGVAYHRRFQPEALVIRHAGRIAHESYDGGFTADRPHPLFSGTKSFWGVAALHAQAEGLLSLDEHVADTDGEWKRDPWKKRVTLRDLLMLVAGIPFGGLGSAVPEYEKALATGLRNEPGTTFTYGGIPLQVFGAVFARKLAAQKLTPHAYLHQRILDPAGIEIAKWRTLKDGTSPLPTGAFMTARSWLTYGDYVLANRERYAECFIGSSANPRYGLCWWLATPGAPQDLFYASGSGGQALYVIPSLKLTAVRFAKGGSFNHAVFIKRLVAGL
ncbi:MAG TPA: serine hydrolase [Candidatus Baltobacteraceae bacterium]|jgi:CubicO group peptidase (beta-lactamase class C family)|nr:serine hydrolase [Candidatus Baltobacteraceae bacterium]